jgi:hypothetical protein
VATNRFLKLPIWLRDPERGENSEARRHDAIVCGSAMIGALTMSRLVDDSELSDKIGDKTRNHLSLQRDARGEGR